MDYMLQKFNIARYGTPLLTYAVRWLLFLLLCKGIHIIVFMPHTFHHLLLTTDKLVLIKESFEQELIAALYGKVTSISFLHNPLPPSATIKNGEIFQVMVVGGSIFKYALIKKENDQISIIKETKDSLPVFDTDRIFLEFIDSHLDPSISYLSLNFAYPIQSITRDNLTDAVLSREGKEQAFEGLVGKMVGKTIEEYVFTKYKRMIRVAVANDTVCLFLSEVTKNTWGTTVACIIGTGINHAFAINKEIINLESAGFKQFSPTDSGKVVDLESKNKGRALIEKEIAGAYLYRHFNIINQQNNLGFPPLSSTKELSLLAAKNGSASSLAQVLLERSASLAATQMAGIVEFLSNRLDSTHLANFLFVMEGTLFWEGYNYRSYLEKYLKMFGVDDKLDFSKTRHHSIQGAIKLLIGLS